MADTLKTILDRLYGSIIGRIKSIDFTRQTISDVKDPEKMHCLAVAPEYSVINEFGLQVSQQLTPLIAESIRTSDIGSLDEWGVLLIHRHLGVDETVEHYRADILAALNPIARGGNREDLLYWALIINGIRRAYSYVGSRDVNDVNVDDIEGRLDGAYLYVRSTSGDGVPTGEQMDFVKTIILEDGSISCAKLNVVPIVPRYYDFNFTITPAVAGGSSSLGEVQTKILDITYDVLNDTEPYIKYVDEIRRDFVVNGQFLQQIRNVITKPPYRYNIDDLVIERNGVEILLEQLPQGNIPLLGSYNFV